MSLGKELYSLKFVSANWKVCLGSIKMLSKSSVFIHCWKWSCKAYNKVALWKFAPQWSCNAWKWVLKCIEVSANMKLSLLHVEKSLFFERVFLAMGLDILLSGAIVPGHGSAWHGQGGHLWTSDGQHWLAAMCPCLLGVELLVSDSFCEVEESTMTSVGSSESSEPE